MASYNYITKDFKPNLKTCEHTVKAKELVEAITTKNPKLPNTLKQSSDWSKVNTLSSGFYKISQGPNGPEYDPAIQEKVMKGLPIVPKNKNVSNTERVPVKEMI